MKRKYILSSNDYVNKPIPKEMVLTIKKLQIKLQREENIKFGKRAETVSFVFAAKVFNTHMVKHLAEVLK
jgi:hypothetical protein